MSFGLPPLKPKFQGATDLKIKPNEYGIHDSFRYGISSVKTNLEIDHPLHFSEENYGANQNRLQMAVLRNTQGIHAPLRLAAELKAVESVGRLPFLPSSNLARDTLTGREYTIDFEDILNTSEFSEKLIMPHPAVEHKLGIL